MMNILSNQIIKCRDVLGNPDFVSEIEQYALEVPSLNRKKSESKELNRLNEINDIWDYTER